MQNLSDGRGRQAEFGEQGADPNDDCAAWVVWSRRDFALVQGTVVGHHDNVRKRPTDIDGNPDRRQHERERTSKFREAEAGGDVASITNSRRHHLWHIPPRCTSHLAAAPYTLDPHRVRNPSRHKGGAKDCPRLTSIDARLATQRLLLYGAHR